MKIPAHFPLTLHNNYINSLTTRKHKMTTQATKSVNIMNLVVGNIVHFLGARFEITATNIVEHRSINVEFNAERDTVMCANGKWLDGEIENCYFGPHTDWNFQGNKRVSHAVEI